MSVPLLPWSLSETLLDAIDEAVVWCDPDGALRAGGSRRAREWFGPVTPGASVVRYLVGRDAPQARQFETALMQIGLLPFAVVADQLSLRFRRGSTPFQLSAHAVERGGNVVALVLRVQDITATVAQETEAAESRELVTVARHMVRNPQGLRAAVRSLDELMVALPHVRSEALRPHMHTAKGHAAMLGLVRLTDRLHALESAFESGDDRRADRAFAEVVATWQATRRMVRTVVPADGSVTVRPEELQEVITELARGRHAQALWHMRGWGAPTVAERMQPVLDAVPRMAEALGKQVRVDVRHRHLHLPYDGAEALLQAGAHLVRNAVSHGLERPALRAERGKPLVGTVTVSSWQRGGRFGLQVDDDGGGIDWGRLGALAARAGQPHADRNDLIRALLRGGLTTQATPNEVAGRGQGLSALWQLVEPLWGTLEVWSRPGEGSAWNVAISARRQVGPRPHFVGQRAVSGAGR